MLVNNKFNIVPRPTRQAAGCQACPRTEAVEIPGLKPVVQEKLWLMMVNSGCWLVSSGHCLVNSGYFLVHRD